MEYLERVRVVLVGLATFGCLFFLFFRGQGLGGVGFFLVCGGGCLFFVPSDVGVKSSIGRDVNRTGSPRMAFTLF